MANPDFSNKKLNHHFPINGRYPDNCDFMSLKETQTSSDDNITITNNYYRKNINTLSGDKVKIVKDSDNNYYVSYYGDENKKIGSYKPKYNIDNDEYIYFYCNPPITHRPPGVSTVIVNNDIRFAGVLSKICDDSKYTPSRFFIMNTFSHTDQISDNIHNKIYDEMTDYLNKK